ncbi:MAG: YfhO family protein [Ruminococcus sp.]|nr:YfhO family protein [Ruminococcus sp.]
MAFGNKRSDSRVKRLRPAALPHYSRERYLTAFLLGFFVLLVCLVPVTFFEKGYFIYYGDYVAQQIPFYNTVNDAVRSGAFGWHWFTDLGSDLLTSYSFYLIGSPFFWLSVLLPRALVTYAMPVLLALKHGFASLTAYIYIRRFVRSKSASLIGGLLYAFSGFQIYNIFFNHFSDVTAFFPLMLIAMEENINNRRRGWFAAIVAVMAVINYYFFCGQAVFLMIYYLIRMRCSDFRTSWKKFWALLLEAVLGTALAAFILLPSFLSLLGNYRITEHYYGLENVIYSDDTLIPRIIQTFFMPSDPPAVPNLFQSDYEKWASIGGYFPLFGMLGVITFMRTHRKHWAVRLSAVCIFMAFIPILNSLFQMANSYYYARWFYMPILIFAMMTARSLDEPEPDYKPAVWISVIALAVFAVTSVLPSQLATEDNIVYFNVPDDFEYFLLTIGVAAISLIAAVYVFDARRRGIRPGWGAVAATALFSAGCVLTMVLYSASTPQSANEYIDEAINGKKLVYEEVSEDNFFRIDISENCDNYSMIWGLPNMRAFQSVVSPSVMNFYSSIDVQRDVASRADVSHYTLRGLFSVKYFYREITDSNRDEEFSGGSEGSSSINPVAEALNSGKSTSKTIKATEVNIPEYLPGFELVGQNEYFRIYENTLYVPMGFEYDTYITEEEAEELKKSTRERILMKALVLTDEQVKKYGDILKPVSAADKGAPEKSDYIKWCAEKQAVSADSFTWDSHGFEAEITLDEPGLVFFSVPYSDGWTAKVNGADTDVEKVSYGFMAVPVKSGTSTIAFSYETPGFRLGMLISAGGLLLLIAWLILCKIVAGEREDYNISHCYDYDIEPAVAASEIYSRAAAGTADRKRRKKPEPERIPEPDSGSKPEIEENNTEKTEE